MEGKKEVMKAKRERGRGREGREFKSVVKSEREEERRKGKYRGRT